MSQRKMVVRRRRPMVRLAIGGVLLVVASKVAVSETSEMDAFQHAVNTQSAEDALAFMREFGSSHLIVDLLELLPAEVALEACDAAPPSADISERCRSLQAASPIAQAIPPVVAAAPVDVPTVIPAAMQTLVNPEIPPQIAAVSPDATSGEEQTAEAGTDEPLVPVGGGNAAGASVASSGAGFNGAGSGTGPEPGSSGGSTDVGSSSGGGGPTAADPDDGGGDAVASGDGGSSVQGDGGRGKGPKGGKPDKDDKPDKGSSNGGKGKGKGGS